MLFFPPSDFPANPSHVHTSEVRSDVNAVTSISGNCYNGPPTMPTHMLVRREDVNARKPSDKRLFFGLLETTVPGCSGMYETHSGGAGVPMTLAASGEFGLRTSCPPEWTEDTRASHGVTVGHLRPTPGHNVITPNQEGFMDSSWAPGLSQTNQQSSLSLKIFAQKCFVPKFRRRKNKLGDDCSVFSVHTEIFFHCQTRTFCNFKHLGFLF